MIVGQRHGMHGNLIYSYIQTTHQRKYSKKYQQWTDVLESFQCRLSFVWYLAIIKFLLKIPKIFDPVEINSAGIMSAECRPFILRKLFLLRANLVYQFNISDKFRLLLIMTLPAYALHLLGALTCLMVYLLNALNLISTAALYSARRLS